LILEVSSKAQVRLKKKAQTDEKAQSAKVLWRTNWALGGVLKPLLATAVLTDPIVTF